MFTRHIYSIYSDCKSAHQAFSQRIKTINMSTFTHDEVESLRPENGGSNKIAEETFMGDYSERQLPRPRKGDVHTVWKDFVQRVYIDKEFFVGGRGSRGGSGHGYSDSDDDDRDRNRDRDEGRYRRNDSRSQPDRRDRGGDYRGRDSDKGRTSERRRSPSLSPEPRYASTSSSSRKRSERDKPSAPKYDPPSIRNTGSGRTKSRYDESPKTSYRDGGGGRDARDRGSSSRYAASPKTSRASDRGRYDDGGDDRDRRVSGARDNRDRSLTPPPVRDGVSRSGDGEVRARRKDASRPARRGVSGRTTGGRAQASHSHRNDSLSPVRRADKGSERPPPMADLLADDDALTSGVQQLGIGGDDGDFDNWDSFQGGAAPAPVENAGGLNDGFGQSLIGDPLQASSATVHNPANDILAMFGQPPGSSMQMQPSTSSSAAMPGNMMPMFAGSGNGVASSNAMSGFGTTTPSVPMGGPVNTSVPTNPMFGFGAMPAYGGGQANTTAGMGAGGFASNPAAMNMGHPTPAFASAGVYNTQQHTPSYGLPSQGMNTGMNAFPAGGAMNAFGSGGGVMASTEPASTGWSSTEAQQKQTKAPEGAFNGLNW
ncbi:hypothetical protein, variant [Sphaeroforma arctica JP610]|uniref:Arf-GAP domain-containing protein n=1 Tax=Sphaeroforma arctica JP610 TaxID=667725 RepID=A0A0L0FXA1_9EUKA|nr:hypothetical protein, variant [Sphaeroforma arctica JP610]KNC81475.1 hypothetical protein, variant [Sphaeroforma arctica JP610]|eukprot:XP_014155377.1 hypothetical protein, variant [Sphaeroforma arctica JP610]